MANAITVAGVTEALLIGQSLLCLNIFTSLSTALLPLLGLMSRDREGGGAEDDLCSLISSTTDIFTSLDVTDSVTDLTVSESTLTQSSNNKTELSTSRTGEVTDEGDKSSVNCDQNSRQILSARELHNQHNVKICTDV